MTAGDFTAKDYCTWAGSSLALPALRELPRVGDRRQAAHRREMVKRIAKELGNTPAVCRKCYIHPAVLDSYLLGTLAQLPTPRQRKHRTAKKSADDVPANALAKATGLVRPCRSKLGWPPSCCRTIFRREQLSLRTCATSRLGHLLAFSDILRCCDHVTRLPALP